MFVLLVLVLLLLAKFYAILSDSTIFFCFTIETGAMEFSNKLVGGGRVQSQPHIGTDVVVEPRRHVQEQNNGGSEFSLTSTVSVRRIQSWKRTHTSQQLGEVDVESSSTRTISCMTLVQSNKKQKLSAEC